MKKKMFYGASALIFENARELRNNMTHAEHLLWGYLRTKPAGFKFRRQHPIGFYIADFYCDKLKLVIEVDGEIHEADEARLLDKVREENLLKDGLKVHRIKNKDILSNQYLVFEKINLLIIELSNLHI
jgi:very-short-patch-repair endonuclease